MVFINKSWQLTKDSICLPFFLFQFIQNNAQNLTSLDLTGISYKICQFYLFVYFYKVYTLILV